MQTATDKYSLKFEDITLIGSAEFNHAKILMRHCDPMCSDVYMRIRDLFMAGTPVRATLAKDGKILEEPLVMLWSVRDNKHYGVRKLEEDTLLLIEE